MTTTEVSLRKKIIELLRECDKKELMRGEGPLSHGNISARIPRSNLVVIKPSGGHPAKLKERDLIIVDLNGKVVKGKAKPSYETDVHCAIYRRRSDINGVVHIHPPYALALSAANIPVIPWCDEGLTLEGVPVVPRVDYDREQQITYILDALGDKGKCVTVQYHGAFAGGKDLNEAYLYASEIEAAARIQWLASMLPSARPIPMAEATKLGHSSSIPY